MTVVGGSVWISFRMGKRTATTNVELFIGLFLTFLFEFTVLKEAVVQEHMSPAKNQ